MDYSTVIGVDTLSDIFTHKNYVILLMQACILGVMNLIFGHKHRNNTITKLTSILFLTERP